MPQSTLQSDMMSAANGRQEAPMEVVEVALRGQAVLNNPRINKGTAFTQSERMALGLDGLLPPGIATLQMQAQRNYQSIMAKTDPLERYIGLVAL